MLSVAECERIARVVCDVPVTATAPDVSVVIPVHNEPERLLHRCTDSLLAQTFTGEIEALLVDDASTDDTLARCEAIAREYNEKADAAEQNRTEQNKRHNETTYTVPPGRARVRFRVFSLRENSGSAAVPRNIGVAYARGKYVAFLDSDDYMREDSYEKLYAAAEADGLDLIVSGIRAEIPPEVAESYDSPPKQACVDCGVTDIAALDYDVVRSICGSVTDKFIRRSLFSDNPALEFVGFRYLDDTVVGYMSLVLSRRVRFIADCFYRATIDGGRKDYHLVLADGIDIWLEVKTRLGERYIRELERKFDNDIIERIAVKLRKTTDPDIVKYILDKVQTVFIPNTYLATAPQREFEQPYYRDLLKTWRKITPERFCELNGIVWKEK
ncbi:hypothetical protein FACS1894133_1040 [Clostridia bacterium]|nr:hypothetical protein FACS1894133_1040 [Clostridia bacterium]